MRTPPRTWNLLILLTGCLGLLATRPREAAGYTQRQGQAVLQLPARLDRDGRTLLPLAGAPLTVTVTGPPPVQAAWEGAFVPGKGWKVRKVAAAEGKPDPRRWEETYYVEPVGKPGTDLDLLLPPLRFRAGDQPERRVTWRPIRARVTTEIKEATLNARRPNTGPEEVPPAWSWRQPLGWVLAGLVLIVLVLVVGEIVGRRRRRPILLTPEGWARRELQRLAAIDLLEAGELERFPTLLSDVVRRYLELQFRLRAPRQTTAEFLEAMQQAPQLTPAQRELLREFLQRCDLAKFARLTPSAAECQALAEQVRGFVEQTAAGVPSS
jgi:hypothetical protein